MRKCLIDDEQSAIGILKNDLYFPRREPVVDRDRYSSNAETSVHEFCLPN